MIAIDWERKRKTDEEASQKTSVCVWGQPTQT